MRQSLIDHELPEQNLSSKIDTDNNTSNKLIVVIVCGLNDWRTAIERFPRGNGIESFKTELGLLVDDIKSLARDMNYDCQIYLPAIPISATASDPKCFFQARPLKDVVEFIGWLWDSQKIKMAELDVSHVYFYFNQIIADALNGSNK